MFAALLLAFFSSLCSPIGFSLLLLLPFLWGFYHSSRKQGDSRDGKLCKLPPGPRPLPLIGNFAQIDLRNPHRSFVRWKKEFGPIYTVWLPKPQLVIAGAKELNELLANPGNADVFADRPTFSFLYTIFSGHQVDGDGIILARRGVWQKNRRFALSAFRNLGMGRPRMEARICVHKNALIRRLAQIAAEGGGGTGALVPDIHAHFACCFANIIQDLVMGRHYEFDDPEFLFFKGAIDRMIKETTSVQMLIVDRFPALRLLFPAYWRYVRDGFALQHFFLREIEAHVGRLKAGDFNKEEPDSFIDAYLLAALAEGEEEGEEDQQTRLDDPALRLSLALCSGDLWAGGLETVVTTTTWAVLFLIHHPDVQNKLQKELDDHLQGRPFDLNDRNELPYFRACLDELQRIVNVLPWNIPHSTRRTITLSGRWTIPEETIVMPQIGAVHMDPDNFAEPEQFRPERFLDENGQHKANDMLRPFGIGKRSCLGESLARMELPIVFASILQNFHFGPVNKDELPSLCRNTGMTSTADRFQCVIRRRFDELIL